MTDTPNVEGQAYTAPSDAPVGTLLTNSDGQTMQVTELFAVMIDDTTKALKRGPSIGTYTVPANMTASAADKENHYA